MIFKTINYDSFDSIVTALQGQDALIITMANTAPAEQQIKLVRAAAAAKVPWILPNEWGSDTSHPYNAGIYKSKIAIHSLIEELGSQWIAVVSNQWYEMSLSTGRYGIDVKNKTATFYDDGETRTTTTTKSQVGRTVARLLSLPVTGPSPSLSDFANQYIFVKSFFLSQKEMLEAVLKNTNTTVSDWTINKVNLGEFLETGRRKAQEGSHTAMLDWVSASNFAPDSGNDFATSKRTVNETLNLPEENLDEATQRAIVEAGQH